MRPLDTYLYNTGHTSFAAAVLLSLAQSHLDHDEFKTFQLSSFADHSIPLLSLRSSLGHSANLHSSLQLPAWTFLFVQHYTDSLT